MRRAVKIGMVIVLSAGAMALTGCEEKTATTPAGNGTTPPSSGSQEIGATIGNAARELSDEMKVKLDEWKAEFSPQLISFEAKLDEFKTRATDMSDDALNRIVKNLETKVGEAKSAMQAMMDGDESKKDVMAGLMGEIKTLVSRAEKRIEDAQSGG